jgi:two-component system, chemotaxis family, chemotaxis protein CheY
VSSARVLVVEDDDTIRDFVTIALQSVGYDVGSARHGAAALDLLQDDEPNLILLDMRMPVMDGWQFSRLYREAPGPHAPIVVFTAAQDARETAEEVQADGFLAKPFHLADLLAVVGQHV